MIQFVNTKGQKDAIKHIGRADVIGLVRTDDEGRVLEITGRPEDPRFLVRITFASNSPFLFDQEVPTGTPQLMPSMDEMIVTDGDIIWEAARMKSPEQLEASETPADRFLYVLSPEELPERLTQLSIDDKMHMIEKIRRFANEWAESLGGEETL